MRRTLEICFPQASAHGAVQLLARFYREGWETLEETRYHTCCGLYRTVLYLPAPTESAVKQPTTPQQE